MARKAIVHLFLFMTAIFCGALCSQRPWQVLHEQSIRTDAAVKEMRASESRREELVRQEARYRSSLGREELARARGLVKPGERPTEIPAPELDNP